jgi:hypothetical protein
MSWNQLITIREENRANAEAEAIQPLVDCPICATRLNLNGDGKRDCPMGDWTELTCR